MTAINAGDSYRLADHHHTKGHLYATTVHISALKRFAINSKEQGEQEEESDSKEEAGVSSNQEELNDALEVEELTPPEETREEDRPKRIRRRPTLYDDYVLYFINE